MTDTIEITCLVTIPMPADLDGMARATADAAAKQRAIAEAAGEGATVAWQVRKGDAPAVEKKERKKRVARVVAPEVSGAMNGGGTMV